MKVHRIESRDNRSVKLARKVRDGHSDDLIFVEGVRLAEEAIRSDIQIEFCLVSSEFGSEPREENVLSMVSRAGIEILQLAERTFASVADTTTSQGVILIGQRPSSGRRNFTGRLTPDSDMLPITVAMLKANNPTNLGAVVRVTEAASAEGLIVSKNSANVFSSKSLRSSMGSAFRLPIWTNAEEREMFVWATQQGMITTGALIDSSISYTSLDWTKPRLLIFGSEAHGIDGHVRARLDETVNIPMANEVESLNLAVSVGIILFEARRQFDLKRKAKK